MAATLAIGSEIGPEPAPPTDRPLWVLVAVALVGGHALTRAAVLLPALSAGPDGARAALVVLELAEVAAASLAGLALWQLDPRAVRRLAVLAILLTAHAGVGVFVIGIRQPGLFPAAVALAVIGVAAVRQGLVHSGPVARP